MLGSALPLSFLERNWLWLLLAAPIALYATWIGSMVVPKAVPEVVRSVLGR